MNVLHQHLKSALIVLIILFSGGLAQAQLPGFFQRMQLGYSYTMAWAEYESKDHLVDENTGATYTKDVTTKVSSKFGYGGSLGSTIPVKRLGKKSMFAIGVDFTYNAYVWDYKVPMFSGYIYDSVGDIEGLDYLADFAFTGATVQMGLPVSADFKFGCDAITDKTVRFCGTIGAGAYPSMSATVDASNAGFGFGVTPFVKAEVGIMAGLCFKLRADISFGNIPFYKEGASIYDWANFKSSSSLTGKQAVSLSLIIMPFAWNWNSTGWWNTY